MNKAEVCALIREIGIIPAIRVCSADQAHFAAEAVTRGGIPIVEITMTVPGAVDLISHLVKYHPKMMVGAGTVLDIGSARQCVDAGAHFLAAPGFDREIVEFAGKQNIAVLPGALTPTTIKSAARSAGTNRDLRQRRCSHGLQHSGVGGGGGSAGIRAGAG